MCKTGYLKYQQRGRLIHCGLERNILIYSIYENLICQYIKTLQSWAYIVVLSHYNICSEFDLHHVASIGSEVNYNNGLDLYSAFL